MAPRNVETHRAGHEAFNRRDFAAMTSRYADSIAWTDHAQGRTFRTPEEFRDDFLAGWVQASSDIRIVDPHYLDAGQTVMCTFTSSAATTGRWDRCPPPTGRSPLSCASCGTSTPAGGSPAVTSTTTRSRCSPRWA